MSTEITEIQTQMQRFELEQRQAKAFSMSVFFPQHLKGQGPNAQLISTSNAVVVYDLAYRMNVSPLEIAQSIFIIYGKPSFETKFLVARLNMSGKIKGRLKTIISDDKKSAYCEAIDAETGETYRGSTITLDMAAAEGWLSKSGSKWKTMPELMLRYRAQSFFINEYYPEVKLGIKSKEELQDSDEITIQPKKPNLNEIVSEKEKKELLEVEIEPQTLPHDELEKELVARGIDEDLAEDVVSRFSKEQVLQLLSDPNAIDNLIEQSA
ncbi:hypothetical protein [Campylobacter pinnipediorum]|uniref:hypothetical protein n=1 Tax=Campylobacter pinnipediorum TaxID=1965231 RepID=UPI0009954D88|nr:hypothetical protein [Campylobacter pinnipediorum]AQW81398.1 hypothetical protein CPIN17260_1109 [Campylobacter pinnipediorum subsp. pinnipediorum]AQW83024.1 hypothetical protein CPIN17261_1020 [Campylobacter pinnipediorum subsp. pinnipediorum]